MRRRLRGAARHLTALLPIPFRRGAPEPPDARPLLIERGRIGLSIIIASNFLFAVTDLRLPHALMLQVYAVKALQIGAALLALWWLGRVQSRAAVVRVTLVVAAIMGALVAYSGALTHDIAATMILCLAFAWGTASLLPIGIGPQCAVALIAGLSMLLNVWLLGHLADLRTTMAYPALAIGIALGASVCVAYASARHRALLEREARERCAAEARLREAQNELERRVRERTAELEHANHRLEQTGATLRASEQRFRMVSELTSDYAYCARLQEDMPSVTEWVTDASFTRVTGFSPAEVAARGGGLSLVHPADLPIVLKRLETLILGGRPDVTEFRIVLRDGSVRWIREHGYPEPDPEQPGVVRLYGAAQDVTERRQAEQALAEQERFVSAVLETVGALVGVVDRDGRVVRFNRACEQTFGYTFDEVRGRCFWDLLPIAEEIPPARAVFERLLAGRWPTTYDTHWITRSGERRNLAWSTTFLRDEQGAVSFVIGTGIDITERQAAEAALRHSEQHWRALIERSTDLIGILAPDATIRYLSPSIRGLLGYDADEWIGRHALELVHPQDASAVVDALRAGIEHRDKGGSLVFRARHCDGSWRVLEGVDTNLIGVAAVDGIVVNLRDLTERCAAEEALALLNEDLEQRVHDRTAQLEAANRELESFSYSVSHDLRAPLRHIREFARVLAEDCAGQLDAAGRGHLERVIRSAQRMDELVEALLTLSQVGRAAFRRTVVDLTAMAGDILAELGDAEPERVVDISIAAGIVGHGDRRLLRVAMDNLLGNAWKYTSQRSRARIEFGVAEHDGAPAYFVRDDGAGFDMTYAERLFTPFRRLHAQAQFEGTGIGLATVQRIIHRHGGRAWAESAKDCGATFFFTLGTDRPRRRSRSAQPNAADPSPAPSAGDGAGGLCRQTEMSTTDCTD